MKLTIRKLWLVFLLPLLTGNSPDWSGEFDNVVVIGPIEGYPDDESWRSWHTPRAGRGTKR